MLSLLPGCSASAAGTGVAPRRGRRQHIQDIRHFPEFDRLEIQHFFNVYKDLEPGKSVEGSGWTGRSEAEAEIVRSRERLLAAVKNGPAPAHP